ncbi:MAG: peptidase [Bacteroidetes bacterium]|nr:MAG: peptidase [Bacteroidota bacterium]
MGFDHMQSAHCENGVTANLLRFHGLDISEAMVFGVGSGIFFCHVPFLLLNKLPLTSYRVYPGMIFSRANKRLGVKMKVKRYRNADKSMSALDKMLDEGLPVGLQTSVFYLPYLPKSLRFHFNAHNIIVYGKQNGNYLISDPVMEYPTEISYVDLQRARYAKGIGAPSGKMYYPTNVPKEVDFRKPIVNGIKGSVFAMTRFPGPCLGIKGVRYLSKRLRTWPEKMGERRAGLNLGQVIRMQEEIGTGGGGFRFIFGAFLQEAAAILDKEWLMDVSKEITASGDHWREFAVMAGRIFKRRQSQEENYDALADILIDIADKEDEIFYKLKEISL